MAMDLLQASAVALYVLVAVMWVRMRGYAAARGRAAAALRGLLALAGAVYVLLAKGNAGGVQRGAQRLAAVTTPMTMR